MEESDIKSKTVPVINLSLNSLANKFLRNEIDTSSIKSSVRLNDQSSNAASILNLCAEKLKLDSTNEKARYIQSKVLLSQNLLNEVIFYLGVIKSKRINANKS